MRVFWEKPEYDPLRLKDISEDEIKKVEKKLNLTLPQQYKKLIIQQNGGLINLMRSQQIRKRLVQTTILKLITLEG